MNNINTSLAAKRMQERIDELGLTYEAVAAKTGFSKSVIYRYAHGQVQKIDLSRLAIIADALNVSPEWLGFGAERKTQTQAVKIPVLGFVRAGIPMNAIENIIDYEEISEEVARSGEFFALKIKGDSMEPKISEGDVVIIRKQSTVENGEVAVVLINGNDATVKKFHKTDVGIKLISTNPQYDPFFFSPQEVESLPVEVIGKVVELRAKF